MGCHVGSVKWGDARGGTKRWSGAFHIEKAAFQTQEPSRAGQGGGGICCLTSQLLFLNIFDSQALIFFGESLTMVLMN